MGKICKRIPNQGIVTCPEWRVTAPNCEGCPDYIDNRIEPARSSGRTIKGRCWVCNKAFQWEFHKGRELKHTPCPICNGKLHQTAHYLRSCDWYELSWPDNWPTLGRSRVAVTPIQPDEVRDCAGRPFKEAT